VPHFEVAARVAGGGLNRDIVGCFDPTIVVVRLKDWFPDLIVDLRDYAWKDYDSFKQRGIVEGAVRIAENDARRRGPIWAFRIPSGPGQAVRGHAERYIVSISSEEPIPVDLKARFWEFLNTLKFAPFVEVSSVKIEGNDVSPA